MFTIFFVSYSEFLGYILNNVPGVPIILKKGTYLINLFNLLDLQYFLFYYIFWSYPDPDDLIGSDQKGSNQAGSGTLVTSLCLKLAGTAYKV